MDLFKKVVSKLFDKEEESVLNECIAFDEAGLIFTIFVRTDISKEHLKFAFQEYVRQKQWYLRHTGPASMHAYQTHPDRCTMQVKIGFTAEKERIMQVSWSSPNPAGVYTFRELMMELSDIFAVQNMLKLQTKPFPNPHIELKDIVEEELKPVDIVKQEQISKATQETQGLNEQQRAMAEHVVFEEDDEQGSVFRVVCQLNKDCKVQTAISILSNIANGLECTSFDIQRTKQSCTLKVQMNPSTLIEMEMVIGLNEQKERLLHGTYPEKYVTYGRQFWIRFAEALAKHGCLKGQTFALSQQSQASNANNKNSNNNDTNRNNTQQQEEEDYDSGLEYDSSDYDNSEHSENSVDSDPE